MHVDLLLLALFLRAIFHFLTFSTCRTVMKWALKKLKSPTSRKGPFHSKDEQVKQDPQQSS
jgi:hypothetical protein